MPAKPKVPPVVVIFGDEAHQKETTLRNTLNTLLPPEIDRSLALTTYDTDEPEGQGAPTISRVLEDLATLPFLADRRVVVIRSADSFISAHRDRLETYATKPSPTGVLVLECRSLAKNTRIYKAIAAAGGALHECKKLSGRALADFAIAEARARGKQLDPATAGHLVDLIGPDAAAVASEIDKLALYTIDRPAITSADVSALVGQSREEKIFAVADAAALGRLEESLRLWQQVLATDRAAAFRAVGGLAFVVRRWLGAHQAIADGANVRSVAPRLMMWGRERELQALLRRLRPPRLRQILAEIAELDSQAKSGARSIDRGIEALLARIATTPA